MKCACSISRPRATGFLPRLDVAFIQAEHGHAIADAIGKRGVRKRYYLETRGDVLLKNKELFERWTGLGLEYMFLGLEAIDAEGLKAFRKRVPLGTNFEALEHGPLPRDHGGGQHHRRPGLGRGAVQGHPRLGALGS